MTKLLLPCVSPSVSLLDTHASPRDLIHTLGHTWVDSKRKEEVFNPILPAWWHCCGKLLFFAWERSKSAALFCLCWLGLKLPTLHGLLIAGQHQSKWHKHLISQRNRLSTYSLKQPIVTKIRKKKPQKYIFNQVWQACLSVGSSKSLVMIQLAANCLRRAQMD